MESWILILLRSLFAALLVLVLPGYSVIAWRPEPRKDLLQRLALALGLSVSLNALLALAFFKWGWPLSYREVLVFYAVAGGTALAGWLVNRSVPRLNSRAIALFALLAALIAWRFFQVRGLAFPPWVDAPHHVLIVRKIMEAGILPADLNPYLPVTFYYHFGFHVTTALFAGISGLPLEKAALAMGQILNAAVSLSVYSLGRVVWTDPRRAGVAALLTALVSQMPAYYATWGRYTLISGLVLLPLAMAALLENRESGRGGFKIFFQMILVAGTVLAHYFGGFLLLLFLLVFFGEGIVLASAGKARWGQFFKAPVAGLLGGLVLIAPWLLTIRSSAEKYLGVALTPSGPPLDQIYFQGYVEYLFHLLGPWRNYFLLAGALAGVSLGPPGFADAGHSGLGADFEPGGRVLGISSSSLSTGPFCHHHVLARQPDGLPWGLRNTGPVRGAYRQAKWKGADRSDDPHSLLPLGSGGDGHDHPSAHRFCGSG